LKYFGLLLGILTQSQTWITWHFKYKSISDMKSIKLKILRSDSPPWKDVPIEVSRLFPILYQPFEAPQWLNNIKLQIYLAYRKQT